MLFKFLGITLIPLLLLTGHASAASVWDKAQENYDGPLDITVHRSPACGCCKDWIAHLKKHGFKVTDIETNDVDAVKTKYQLPSQVASCHTAMISGYLIEGHVPADDIKRLLKQKPHVRGLAVPQMPKGAPGMEMGHQKDPFIVFSFDTQGNTTPFNQYWAY
ncbi:MAG: DUF411 domain-containing protein [Gammaproteobacteria bacterium]|nr:DUF411 domain-containing protein [Gammaproteobacteria bacterium]